MRTWRVIAVLVTLFLPGALSYAQSAPCGDIVIPANYYDEDTEEERSPITDCANPFGATAVNFVFNIDLEGQALLPDAVVIISPTTTFLNGTLQVSYPERSGNGRLTIYRRDGDDYFLSEEVPRNRGFSWDNVVAGEHIAVVQYEDNPLPVRRPPSSWLALREYLVPTAHAFDDLIFVSETKVFEFSVVVAELPPPPPTGASSVLFLPGIQASRLYKEGLIFEDQVWPPSANFGNDIFDLEMTPSGFSVETIYTRDVIDSSFGIGSVYGDFLDFLEDQKTAPLPIKDYLPFAYDWRFDVNDIVLSGTQYRSELKAVIDELETLANESYTGKVTVVAHSNGGLLAKAMVRELDFRNQEHLVDKLVLIGVPHLGTPKAIGTVLHGYDQTDKLGGIVINAKDVREVVNNMPGVYGLLPSEAYFDKVSGPLIKFESGASTDPYRIRYGEELDSLGEYREFMYGEDEFDRGIDEVVSTPVTVNRPLFDEALLRHAQIYDNWIAPENIQVIEIVGVGLPTMQSVTYRTNTERKCRVVGNNQILCIDQTDIKPFANLSHMGDATVVEASADGYIGEKQKLYVNLPDLNIARRLAGLESVEHYNFPEADEIQNLIAQLLSTSTISVGDFISQSLPSLNNEYTVEVIDSPVRPLVTDEQGRQTGVVVEEGVRKIQQEIPGSQYFEFGDAKYVVMPRGLPRTTRLYGEAEGGYTLTVLDLLNDDSRVVRSVLQNATVTPSMVVQYQVTSAGYGQLQTDNDGDGVFEQVTDMEGMPIAPAVVTYDDVRRVVKESGLGKLREVALFALLKSAERVSVSKLPMTLRVKAEEKLLHAIIQLVRQYERRRFISQEKADAIVTIVNSLKS